jgi:hypothetical protein
LTDSSQKSSDDANTGGENSDNTKTLPTITRPVFEHRKLNPPLSSFIVDCVRSRFFFSDRSIHLINQSLKGYIQFSEGWKRMIISLDFLPLEQMDEYYYLPEEIEEEIAIPSATPGSSYHDDREVVQRKIRSYSIPLKQGNETTTRVAPVRSFDNNNNLIANDDNNSNASVRNYYGTQRPASSYPSPSPSQKEQRSEISTHQEDIFDSHQQRKSVETIETPKKEHVSPSSKTKDKSPRLSTKLKAEYTDKVSSRALKSKEKIADYSKVRSSDRARSRIVNPPLPLESTQSLPAGEKQTRSQSFSRLIEQGVSRIANKNVEAKHIDQPKSRLKEHMVEEKKDRNHHTIHKRKPSDDNLMSAPDQLRQQIHFKKANNFTKSTETLTPQKHESYRNNNNFSKSVELDIVAKQPHDLTSSTNTSLNPMRQFRTPSHDHMQPEGARNKLPAPESLTAELAPNNSSSNNNNYFSIDNISHDIPKIKVNRLDIHVIGNTEPSPTYSTSSSMEFGESINKLDQYVDEEYDGSTTTLNKSYLWKYKVRL